jgi:hypothetical protein
MNFAFFTALALFLAAMPEMITGGDSKGAPWMVRKTKPTTESTSTLETTVSPSAANLETSSTIYRTKKHKATKSPKPTAAALETTELPSSTPLLVQESSSLAPSIESSAATEPGSTPQVVQESSSLAPAIESSAATEAGSPSTPQLNQESSSLPPSTEAPIVESSAASSAAPEIESTSEEPAAETTMSAGVESSPKQAATDQPAQSKLQTQAPTLPPIDFDCRRKDDGYYANPKDKCSSFYYACVGGLGRKLDCGSSDLVWEPDTSICERRQDSFRCTGTRKTTVPTTPRRPPPPPVKLPIDCSKLDDGWYPDPQKKCSHTFYSCSNRLGSKFECPGHMYFDVDSKGCEAFQDVVACAGKKPPTTKKPSTPAGTTVKIPVNCLDKPSGQYPDPEKKCSQIYYVCSNGDGLKRSCPGGLYYHPKKGFCDYFDEIFACTGRTKPATKPTAAPIPSQASLPSNEFNCTGKKDGTFTPENKKCSQHYFRCVAHVAYKLNCPQDLYYDVDNDLCDHWLNLFVCSGKKPTSPLPVTTLQPKPTEKLPIDCNKYDDGDFADPEKKCSRVYYTCSNNVGSRRLCPEKTVFDKDLSICDIRDNVPACTGKPRPPITTKTTSKPLPSTKEPYNCEKRNDGNFAAGKCINYYWSCVGGSPARADCPHGTYYDAEIDECGYKHEIPSCGGVRPTTQKP